MRVVLAPSHYLMLLSCLFASRSPLLCPARLVLRDRMSSSSSHIVLASSRAPMAKDYADCGLRIGGLCIGVRHFA
eukprot:4379246-Alexandrium_andersonii.AAC.1